MFVNVPRGRVLRRFPLRTRVPGRPENRLAGALISPRVFAVQDLDYQGSPSLESVALFLSRYFRPFPR